MNSANSKPVNCLGLAVHPKALRASDALDSLSRACDKNGIELYPIGDKQILDANSRCDAVASVGGDGTLLSALHRAYPANIPIWGINVGHLGFLTTSGISEIEDGVSRLKKGEYQIEYRAMISAEIRNSKEISSGLVALNDIVLQRKSTSGIAIFDAELDGRYLASYEVDGLIIATPTGSTAYSLSAGGSILSPTLKAFMVTPICAHSLSARPLVFPDSSVLKITPRFDDFNETILVLIDGRETARLSPDTGKSHSVVFGKAPRDAGLLRFGEVVFSDVLRDKLGWAGGSPLGKTI